MSNARNLSNLLGGKTTLSADNVEGVQKKEVTSDTTGLGAGQQADQKFVAGQKSLYLYNGTGWDRVLSGVDGPPQWDSGGSVVASPIALSQNISFDANLTTLDSQRVTLNVNAVDPDGFPITYDFDQHPSSNNIIDSVTQTSAGVFRVTPNIMSGESNANTNVSFRILASDGARVATASTIFSITYSKFTIFKKGAASTGFWGDTYGTNYNYGVDGQSGIGDTIVDNGTTQILNKFGEYWLLPSTTFTADLKMWGAAGSTSSDGVAGSGTDAAAGLAAYSGFGGYTYARMEFTAGQYYTIIVGQGGAFGTGSGNSHGAPASFGGGGHAGRANTGGHNHGRGAGGGLTGIFLGKEFSDVHAVHNASLLIAGGGGGGYGQVGGGGSGGGTSGTGSGAARGGGGASQSAGGAAGGGSYGSGTKSAGDKIFGGSPSNRTGVYSPSGGGGGYYGGGSGAPNNYAGGPGGGGSGYVKSDASITNSGMNTALAWNSDGPSPGRTETEWGDDAGVGNYDHNSTTANPYSGSAPETDIAGWRRVAPGRFAIIPV